MQKYIGIYWNNNERCCEEMDIFANEFLEAFNKLCKCVGYDRALCVQLVER